MVILPGDRSGGSATGQPHAGLLPRRMRALGVAEPAIATCEPGLLEDLQGVCAACECPELCEWDLRHRSTEPDWEAYCPNAVLLKAFAELPRFRLAVTE